jgi:S-DNA-T family DNA segregation ATPase FtsK/SpoIIIE
MGRPKGSKNKHRNEVDEIEEEDGGLEFDITGDAKRSSLAVFLFALAVVILLGFFDKAGVVGESLNKATGVMTGWAKWIFPIFLIIASVVLLLRKETSFYVSKIFGLIIVFASVTGLFHWFFDLKEMIKVASAGSGGGYLGYSVAYVAVRFLGQAGGMVLILSLFLIGIIVAFNFSIINFVEKIVEKRKEAKLNKKELTRENQEMEEKTEVLEEEVGVAGDEEVGVENNNQEEDFFDEESNIGKIEFAEGRDQYVDIKPEEEDETEIVHTEFKVRGSNKKKKAVKKSAEDDDEFAWELPPADLLEKNVGGVESGDTDKNAELIEKTFKSFGIDVAYEEALVGPAVTQYSFRPADGVKITKILELNNNLAMALAKHPIRIEAPIPGKSLIGIEVPNNVPAKVRLRNLIESANFAAKSSESTLTLALGEDVSGEYILADLGKMPHLLIAGSTGTGKSVCVNSIITTLLYQNSPEELRFIMVDPKRVELSMYSGIPHLLTPVITENKKVVNALKWVVGEMERRYKLLQDMKSQNIASYKEKMEKGEMRVYVDQESGELVEEPMEKLPFIVVVIDELAELMMSHGKEVEGAIVRVAQLARAVGIHLIVSTQRPEVKIITGLIKANINARIALKVNTQVDSRTILDMAGAEKLLGSGDMLFLSSSAPKTKRIQGIFLSEAEVKKVVQFIKDQDKLRKEKIGESIDDGNEIELAEDSGAQSTGNADPLNLEGASNGNDEDDMYEPAKSEVIKAGKASASLLQRRLRVGYSRAARLLDLLEDNGVIGPADGAKPREVFAGNNNASQDAINYDSAIDDQVARDKWQA